jgi:hypothetical protein
VNDCPDSKTVAGGSGNKPPGKVSSYSVRIAPDIETLREFTDTTEMIDHLELGLCELMIESFMVDESDYRRQCMGDPLVRRVEHVLAMSAPYPGDNTMDLGTYRRDRFSVFRETSTHHIIWDREKFEEDGGTIIHSHQLEDRSFRIGEWYAQEMARKGYESTNDIQTQQQRSLVMGDALALRVEEILMAEFDPDWCGSG